MGENRESLGIKLGDSGERVGREWGESDKRVGRECRESVGREWDCKETSKTVMQTSVSSPLQIHY